VITLDALLSGSQWSGTLTYSFPDIRGDYETGYSEASNGFSQVSSAQMQAVRYILEGASRHSGGPRMSLTSVESFTNLSVSDAGSGLADIRLGQSYSADPTAYAYLPSSHPAGGDVWFGTQINYRNPQVGTYAFATVIHELGHSLGLKHPHDMDDAYSVTLPSSLDAMEYTIMSYRSYVGQTASGYRNEGYGFAQTYMMYDIAALQTMYGADFTTHSTDTQYRWNPTTGEAYVNGTGQGAPGGGIGGSANRIFQTIWDGGGVDLYDFSNYTTDLRVDLRPGRTTLLSSTQQAYLGDGKYASGNVYNALQYQGDTRSLIERAKGGTGDDRLIGNTAANSLSGRDGHDTLYGMTGNDALYGGTGNDTFVFSTTLSASSNVDKLPDFVAADDTMTLVGSIFSSLTYKGALSSGHFRSGTAAQDANDFIIYNKANGSLYYDADGSGPQGMIRFADLNDGSTLSYKDFLII
jgi:serralysin